MNNDRYIVYIERKWYEATFCKPSTFDSPRAEYSKGVEINPRVGDIVFCDGCDRAWIPELGLLAILWSKDRSFATLY